MGIQKDILTNFHTILSTITWANLVTYDKIRISSDDFREHEIPVIQFWPNAITGVHVQGRIQATMEIIVEVVLKADGNGAVNVGLLMDRVQEVEQKIGENVQLNVNGGMIHVKWRSSETDLHLIAPYYIGVIIFEVEYFKPYTGSC